MKTGCYCYAVKQCQRSWNPLVRYVRIHVNNAKLFLSWLKMFECSLNADWGGKKRFQVMYTNGKARKMTLSLRYFLLKASSFFKKQKTLCFSLFFWSVKNRKKLKFTKHALAGLASYLTKICLIWQSSFFFWNLFIYCKLWISGLTKICQNVTLCNDFSSESPRHQVARKFLQQQRC